MSELLPYPDFDDFYQWVHTAERSFLRSLNNVGNYFKTQLFHLNELEKKSHIGKDGFQLYLDVEHFSPDEITVKMENNTIIVNAKHEEKKDEHGYISREFTRRYDLPNGFKSEDVTASLSSDGFLSIKCPHDKKEGANIRQIEIQQTDPVTQSIKSNEEQTDEK